MSKYILLPKPVAITSWCTDCKTDTKQIVAFVKYEAKTHTMHYLNRCTKCGISHNAEANIKYWVNIICKGIRTDKN